MIFLYGLGVLGLIITIHELGHFVVGRAMGVKFLSFSIGMGPRILRMKILDTPFFISLLPLGGYVRPLALLEEDLEEKDNFANKCYRFLAPIDEEEKATLSRYDSGSFENVYNKSYFAQASIILGGVLFNLLSVIFVHAGFLFFLKSQNTYHDVPIIHSVNTKSMAEYAGFKPQDRILAVDGKIFYDWESAYTTILGYEGKQVPFDILRTTGDNLTILRLKLFQNPEFYDIESPIYFLKKAGLAPPIDSRPYTISEAFRDAFFIMWINSKDLFKGFTGLAKPGTPDPLMHGAKAMSSPIVGMFEIGLIASQSTQAMVSYFSLISLIVIFFNLLPLPILDGGQLLILTLEKVFNVSMPAKRIHAIQQFGFSFVLLLTIFLLGKDLIEAWM